MKKTRKKTPSNNLHSIVGKPYCEDSQQIVHYNWSTNTMYVTNKKLIKISTSLAYEYPWISMTPLRTPPKFPQCTPVCTPSSSLLPYVLQARAHQAKQFVPTHPEVQVAVNLVPAWPGEAESHNGNYYDNTQFRFFRLIPSVIEEVFGEVLPFRRDWSSSVFSCERRSLSFFCFLPPFSLWTWNLLDGYSLLWSLSSPW